MNDDNLNVIFGFWPNLLEAFVFLAAGLMGTFVTTKRIKDAKKNLF